MDPYVWVMFCMALGAIVYLLLIMFARACQDQNKEN
jgi:bacteriorhodopsin